MCDEFSGYMAARVINNKNPETILKAFHERSVREGPGIPKAGIFSDRGGEFRNPAMKEMTAKYGIKLNITAGFSPWSNGKNERNHYSCDRTVVKLMEDDKNLNLEEAVSHAVHAHNLQVKKSGFSPNQLMFGHQSVIPGVSDGNPPSMEPIIESEVFRREFVNRHRAEETYRSVDANERLQKILKQQTYGYLDTQYNVGDSVYFKEEDNDSGLDLQKY